MPARIDPRRRWRTIHETTNPVERLDRVRQVLARVQPELQARRREAEELTAAHVAYEGHPGLVAGAAREAVRLRAFAALVLALDLPVQYLLNSAGLPEVAAWKIALGSLALPLGLAGAIHYLGEPLLYDPDRPFRSVRIAKILAAVSFIATGLAAAVFLFARQASAEIAGSIVGLTTFAIWTVAEGLPLTAGFTGMWAHMLLRPAIHADRLQRVKEEIATLERFLERLEGEKSRLESNLTAPQQPVRSPAATGVASSAATLVALATVLGGVSSIAAQSPPGKQCAVFVDRSKSVNARHRKEALQVLVDQLERIGVQLGCTELIVGSFSDEGQFAPRRSIQVPVAPVPVDCSIAFPPSTETSKGFLGGVKGFRDHFQKQAAEECLKTRETSELEYHRKQQRFLAVARLELSVAQEDKVTPTDIFGVLESLILSGVREIILLTDGLDTLHRGQALRIPGDTRIALVLVPPVAPYGDGEAVTRTIARWNALGVSTMPYTVLVSPSAWTRILAKKTSETVGHP